MRMKRSTTRQVDSKKAMTFCNCKQALLGEGAGVVLEGQRVLPKRAEELQFGFKFSDVDSAVRNILR